MHLPSLHCGSGASGPYLEAFPNHLKVDALLEVAHPSDRVQELERIGTGKRRERASGRRLAQPRRHCVEHRLGSGVGAGQAAWNAGRPSA